MGLRAINNPKSSFEDPYLSTGLKAASDYSNFYKDPDAASLLMALSFDNNDSDVQNTIRTYAQVGNGTLITVDKGSAATYNSANEKFPFYDYCGYSGDNWDNGYWYCTSGNSPAWLKRLEIPFTIQFWIKVVNFNEVWPGQWHGTAGNCNEPASGRSGWLMRFGYDGDGDGLDIKGYSSGDSATAIRAQFADNSMTNPMTTGAWHHVAFSVPGNSTASRIVFDGTHMTTMATDGWSSRSDGYICDDTVSTNTYLFGRGNEYAYDGRKDLIDAYVQDYKWYSTARTVANIQADYNRGKAMLNPEV